MSQLLPIIETQIIKHCQEEGFSRIGRSRWFYRDGATEEFQDLLFFCFSTYSASRSVGVFPAIRHLGIEKLYKQITGDKLSAPLWVLNTNIGYLTPQSTYKEWDFYDNSNIKAECHEMFGIIRRFAYPFYDQVEDVEYLLRLYESNGNLVRLDQQFIILPLLYLLVGKKEEGILFLEEKQTENRFTPDFRKEYLQKYRCY